jgi:hypothetical protein
VKNDVKNDKNRNDVRQMRIARGVAALTVTISAVAAVAGLRQPEAEAFPAYSKKENKPCSYCHVNTAGGGKRNAAGDYYQKNNHSFVGYTPEGAAADAAPTPAPTATPSAKPTPKPTPKPKPKPAAAKGGKKPAPKTAKK